MKVSATQRYAALMAQLMLFSLLAGCTGALDTTVDPRYTLEAYPVLIQEGEMVTLDARESSPSKASSRTMLGTSETVRPLKQ